jgi:hypothetical protein
VQLQLRDASLAGFQGFLWARGERGSNAAESPGRRERVPSCAKSPAPNTLYFKSPT